MSLAGAHAVVAWLVLDLSQSERASSSGGGIQSPCASSIARWSSMHRIEVLIESSRGLQRVDEIAVAWNRPQALIFWTWRS